MIFCLANAPLSTFAQLLDAKATKETKNLYQNLIKLKDKGVMFGHQDDLAYGVEWKYLDNYSDIQQISGDYPAVYGWEIGNIEHDEDKNIDGVPFYKLKEYIKQVYDNGGVNTISWHIDNPVSLGSAWDTTKAVSSILPGGEQHDLYVDWLKKSTKFFKSLRGSDHKRIPILFRPFHELNGGWFWWGAKHCTPEEYKELWKFTVDYMRKMRVKNLIYVYNTNSFTNAAEFMERYPGDDYADVVSFDSYQFSSQRPSDEELKISSTNFNANLKKQLFILDSVATVHNKLATLAETGYEAIPDKTWWTATLWDAIKDYKISYVLLWRNFGWRDNEQKWHYYTPFKGQKSEVDFKKFHDLDSTLFLNDIKDQHLYK